MYITECIFPLNKIPPTKGTEGEADLRDKEVSFTLKTRDAEIEKMRLVPRDGETDEPAGGLGPG